MSVVVLYPLELVAFISLDGLSIIVCIIWIIWKDLKQLKYRSTDPNNFFLSLKNILTKRNCWPKND